MHIYMKIIRELLATTELTDPAEVAEAALAEMSEEDKAEALRPLMREAARQAMGAQRSGRASDAPVQIERTPLKSRKLASARTFAARFLSHRFYAGEAGWKLLADATSTDLVAAAQERRSLAEANAREADWYEKLSKALETHQATTLSELPAEVLTELDWERQR